MNLEKNLKPPHIIKATYRIVTPMFIGDAEQNATGIAPQSVKGALRFWWRALMWGEYLQEANQNETQALTLLHEAEAKLFGIATDEKREKFNKNKEPDQQKANGQCAFLLSVQQPTNAKQNTTDKNKVHQDFQNCKTARYLAYGLMEPFRNNKQNRDAGQLSRDCLNENQFFTVQLVFRGEPEPSILDALKAFGLLGALGARARHGIGSVSLEKITRINPDKAITTLFDSPNTPQAYRQAIATLFAKTYSNSLPPYTAFSGLSRIDELVQAESSYKVLDAFSEKMLIYRSWGRSSDSNSKEKLDRKFREDHDWFRIKAPKLPVDFHPRRVVFGLPHNYDKESHHVLPEPAKDAKGEGRRASPLWFHVHRLNDKNYLGISIYLPATFLPANKKISANGRLVPQKIEWNVITDFLDGHDKNGKKYFPKQITMVGNSKK